MDRAKHNAVELRLPDFIGVGPTRTGTTWLHEMLQGHAGMPRGPKEVNFFLQHYARGPRWYANFFRDYPPSLKLGEMAPNYFDSEEARERIARDLPACKIFCSLRDPIARLYSVYRLRTFLGMIVNASFEDALRQLPKMAEGNRYAHFLKRWYSAFGQKQVLVSIYDDFEADPQSYLDRITDFVGLARIPLSHSDRAGVRIHSMRHLPRRPLLARIAWRLHTLPRRPDFNYRIRHQLERLGIWRLCFVDGEAHPPIDPALEARLREQFRPEIEELEQLIERDLSAWKVSRTSDRAPSLRQPQGFH